MLGGGAQLEVVDGDADEVDGPDEAQARGGEAGLRGGVGHQRPHGIVRQQEAVEFLDHADGLLAAQRVLDEALVRVDLIDGQFDLPSLMISGDEGEGGGLLGIE